MPDAVLSADLCASRPEAGEVQTKTLNLLAYVHLRNIHESTGAGRVARQMTEALGKREDVSLRVLADTRDHARIVPLAGKPWDGFTYHFMESETSSQQAKWFLFDRPRAERYWQDVEIVYCTAESYVPTRKARLAVTLHDAAYLELGAHRRDSSFQRQRLKWLLLYRKLIRRADLFHTVSHFSAERLVHFFPELRSRIKVVYNAVTSHFFEPPTRLGEVYLETVALSGEPFILVPGGLHFRKNAELILEAWPLLRNLHPRVKLAIVNHSDPEYAHKARGFGDSVKLLGFVPEEGLRSLYSAARAVWFPSRYEGFGLPVVEAMACGAAVVASRASSLPEIAGNAALLASATEPKEHVDALDSLLANEDFRHDRQQRGKQRAAHFTWDKSAAQLKSHFDQLL